MFQDYWGIKMPRRKRPGKTTRSEHWLRVLVSEYPTVLDAAISRAFGWHPDTSVDWVSPKVDDDYAEYYDQAFIDRLRLKDLPVPLKDFWPASGPRWDGLGRATGDKIILLEAKAHIDECVDYKSGASEDSFKVIVQRLEEAREAFGARPDAPWDSPLYQHANRLAHLHFLHGINDVDAYLVYIYFANAPDVPSPVTEPEWLGAIRLTNKCLGLKDSDLFRRVADVVIDVNDIIAS